MIHKFQQVLDKIHDFLNGHDQPDHTETNSLTATIGRGYPETNRCSPYLI